MDCSKRGRMASALPDELLVEILSRVPVKSLRRFQGVSKAWRDLIADPEHRRKLPQTLEGFFYCFYRRSDNDIRGGDGVGGVRVHGHGGGCGRFIDLMGRPVPLVNPSFSFLPELPSNEGIRILHSCNGLLLLRYGRAQRRRGYVVCNPATGEWVAVPSSGGYSCPPDEEDIEESFRCTFLIFDRNLPKPNIQDKWMGLRTYSSETGVWTDRSGEQRRLEEEGKNRRLGSFDCIGTFGSPYLNGMLHFMVSGDQEPQDLIVAVNWDGKTCRGINWPRSRGCLWSIPAFVGVSQGRLCCMSDDIEGSSTKITIWVLDDYDNEKWTMKHSVSYLQLSGISKWQAQFRYDVVGIHPDRNLVFIVEQYHTLVSYNMDSKEVHSLCTNGRVYESITPYVPYFSKLPVLSNKH